MGLMGRRGRGERWGMGFWRRGIDGGRDGDGKGVRWGLSVRDRGGGGVV